MTSFKTGPILFNIGGKYVTTTYEAVKDDPILKEIVDVRECDANADSRDAAMFVDRDPDEFGMWLRDRRVDRPVKWDRRFAQSRKRALDLEGDKIDPRIFAAAVQLSAYHGSTYQDDDTIADEVTRLYFILNDAQQNIQHGREYIEERKAKEENDKIAEKAARKKANAAAAASVEETTEATASAMTETERDDYRRLLAEEKQRKEQLIAARQASVAAAAKRRLDKEKADEVARQKRMKTARWAHYEDDE